MKKDFDKHGYYTDSKEKEIEFDGKCHSCAKFGKCKWEGNRILNDSCDIYEPKGTEHKEGKQEKCNKCDDGMIKVLRAFSDICPDCNGTGVKQEVKDGDIERSCENCKYDGYENEYCKSCCSAWGIDNFVPKISKEEIDIKSSLINNIKGRLDKEKVSEKKSYPYSDNYTHGYQDGYNQAIHDVNKILEDM